MTAYGTLEPEGFTPATLAVLMKAPSDSARASFTAYASHRWVFTYMFVRKKSVRVCISYPYLLTFIVKHMSQSSSLTCCSMSVNVVIRVQPAFETTTSKRPIVSNVSLTRFWTEVLEDISAFTRWNRGFDCEELPCIEESSVMSDCARSAFDE